ncbi:MAG: Nramp family divalent metal transporter [Gemmatimonadaceae bacterium]
MAIRVPDDDRRNDARPEREYKLTPAERLKSAMRDLGPGLITGAADDDPSGIATYSQAGAAFGFGFLWSALISMPLMSAVQLMCARVGLVTERGLASVLRRHYAPWILWTSCALLLVANTINIAADLGGMAAATAMLTGVPRVVFVPLYAVLLLALLIFASYKVITKIFKWLTLVLFAYVASAVLAHPNWGDVLRSTFVPHIEWTRDYLITFVAILGTTISPYLFFWQAASEVEAEEQLKKELGDRPQRALERELRGVKIDVFSGMAFSNIIMYFIILTAGATLHASGQTDVQTAEQAAQALKPIAGPIASLLFTLGIVGTGLLGVPVLAGSAAYAIAEAAAWRRGMDEKPRAAPHFYQVMAAAMLIGTGLALTHFNAIKMLFWAAVVNGLLAPPLIIIILFVCNNEKVMGAHKNGKFLNIFGGLAAILMTGAAAALLFSLL